VRELRNCVERAIIMSGDRIGVDALPFGADIGAGNGAGPERAGVWSPVGPPLANAERDLVLATVQHIPDKGQAAKALGVSLKTLYNRLHKYGARKAFCCRSAAPKATAWPWRSACWPAS
jgi:DNA-binding NtrC family response regulator